MLRKLALVTVIPGTPGREYRPATHECFDTPPPNTVPPPTDSGDGGVVPTAGTPILLEHLDGSVTESVAPAPAGFVCRIETTWVVTPGSLDPAPVYTTVCAEVP